MGSWCWVEYAGTKYQSWFRRDFEIYKLGDTVPWEPNFYEAGEHIDGVHEAEEENADVSGTTHWVIIKDKKIHDFVRCVDPLNCGVDRQTLLSRYGIQPPPRELWPPQAWEYQDDLKHRRAKAKEETEARCREHVERAVERWRTWKPEPAEQPLEVPKTLDDVNASFFMRLVGEWPKTEEEARQQAEVSFYVSDYTRTKMREPGTFRMLFPRRMIPRPELTRAILPAIREEFNRANWPWSWHMLQAAIAWRGEQHLLRLGLIDGDLLENAHKGRMGLQIEHDGDDYKFEVFRSEYLP